jgi:hypothetical protein
MCEPTMIMAAMTALTAASAYQQSATAKAVAENNARIAEFGAKEAVRRGEEEAMAVRRRGAALKSSQRVALAARGVDLGEGTAQELQDQTDFFTAVDSATTRQNAQNEAWARRQQAGQYAAQAASTSPFLDALQAAAPVAGKWYSWADAKTPKGGSTWSTMFNFGG